LRDAEATPTVVDANPRAWLATLTLILGVLVLRIIYLAWFCPYILVEDEAQYWDWARHLSWSYYTKGPGIAWAIFLSRTIFDDSAFAVRLPAALMAAVGAWAVAGLAFDITRSRRVGLYAASAYMLAPVFQVTALLGTIDGPYCACWALACWAAWRALQQRGRWAWLALGAALGVGFLFKYTILLLVPGLLLFAILRRRGLALAPRWPLFAAGGFALAALGLAPVIIWNMQHDWATVSHLLGHLGARETGHLSAAIHAPSPPRPSYSPLWTLELVAIQIAFVGPLLILGAAAVVWAWRGRRTDPHWPGRQFLIACAAPIFIFYLAVSFIAEPEGNWPMAGFVTLITLAAWAAADAMTDYRVRVADWLALPEPRPKRGYLRRKPELPGQILWHFALGYGLVAGIGMLRIDLFATLPVVGRFVPVGRLEGGALMANAVQELRTRLQTDAGREPFVMTMHYGQAAQLAFYLPDRPAVYCASSRTGGRPTQHDFWTDTDLDDPALLGRPAVLVGGSPEQWAAVFDRVEPQGLLAGVERKGIVAYLAHGYRGFSTPKPAAADASERP